MRPLCATVSDLSEGPSLGWSLIDFCHQGPFSEALLGGCDWVECHSVSKRAGPVGVQPNSKEIWFETISGDEQVTSQNGLQLSDMAVE